MDENFMQLALRLHTPEELRQLSNYAHWIEGAIFLTVALILFLQVTGRMKARKADLLWPSLILGAGLFLLVYIFIHHAPDEFGLVWQVILTDPQQRQHVIMAMLLTIAAILQLFYVLKKLSFSWIPYAWPLVLISIGILFILHPQHGTREAIAYMKPYHTVLGAVVLLTGTTVAFAVKKHTSKVLRLAAIGLLTLSALLLLFYREPVGAYQMNRGRGETLEEEEMRVSRGGAVRDRVTFIKMLRARGATVAPAGEVSQEFFPLPGRVITVNGANVQVFEFVSDQEAMMQAQQINPDGSGTKTMMITWVDSVHFYQKGRIIVLYVGKDPETVALLEQLLGPQFAGTR